MKRLLVVALLVAGVSSSCTDGPLGTSGASGRVEVVRGDVRVDAGNGFRRVSRAMDIAPGDRVRTGEDGVAIVRIGKASGELAPLSDVQVVSGRASLRRGSILAAGGLPVEAGFVRVETRGDVRVDRTLTVRAGAYTGSADLRLGGASLRIERYREGSASPGFFPKVSRPLRVDPADRWDRRFLGDYLELERSLESLRSGLDVRPDVVPLVLQAFSVSTAPAFAIGGPRTALSERDTVISAAIAATSPGPFDERLKDAVELRVDGASWAIVAATLDADTEAVLTRLSDALDRATPAPVVPAPGLPGGPLAAGPTAPPSGGTAAGSPAPTPSSTSPPTPPPGGGTPQPTPTPSPVVDGVTDTVCRVSVGLLCLDLGGS